MTVLRPRSKLVYFRVSEDEYQQLSALCERLGARSLSDLVRTSLLQRWNMRAADEEGLESLAARIERLTRLVEELRQKLDESPRVKVSRKL